MGCRRLERKYAIELSTNLIAGYIFVYGSLFNDDKEKLFICFLSWKIMYSLRSFPQERRVRPFGHTAIARVIRGAGFEARDAVARLRPALVDHIPFQMIALASVAVTFFLSFFLFFSFFLSFFLSFLLTMNYSQIMNVFQEYQDTGVHATVGFDGKVYWSRYFAMLEKVEIFYEKKETQCLALLKDINQVEI